MAHGAGAGLLALLGMFGRCADDVAQIGINSADDIGRACISTSDDFGRFATSTADAFGRFATSGSDDAFRTSDELFFVPETPPRTAVRTSNEFPATKGPLVWKAIARQMGPQALRMNLNTLLRHDAFKKPGILVFAGTDNVMIDYVAGPLADVDAIRRSGQFRYQFLAAYLNASDEVPQKIKASVTTRAGSPREADTATAKRAHPA